VGRRPGHRGRRPSRDRDGVHGPVRSGPVRPDGEGEAARAAIVRARRAAAGLGAGPDLYAVTVIPAAAVVLPPPFDPPIHPEMPD
jgi:hypothetical protein